MKNMQKRQLKKINMYENNGFILGENLIATFELEKCPLDMLKR